mgnify:CR=1 FL=1
MAFAGEPRLLCDSRASEREQPEKPDLMRTCTMHPFRRSEVHVQSCLLRSRHAGKDAELTDLQANTPVESADFHMKATSDTSLSKLWTPASDADPAHYNTITADPPLLHAREKANTNLGSSISQPYHVYCLCEVCLRVLVHPLRA